MNIKIPVFKKELFSSVFVSEIEWTLKIMQGINSDGFWGEVYKGKELVKTIGDGYQSYDFIEKTLVDIWEEIVEIEYNRVKQYILE